MIKWAKALNGRPTKMTEETIKKLLDAFSYSFTDEEACVYADISPKTLYNYWEKFPEFLQQKELLKKQPNIKAKMNWVTKINKDKDYQASKEWLERKSRNEFSLKQEIDVAWEMKHDHTLNVSFTGNEDSIS